MAERSFWVMGLPAGKGSNVPYINKSTGKASMFPSSNKALRAWRKAFKNGLKMAQPPDWPLDKIPMEVELHFYVHAPAKHGLYPTVKRHDLDKLVRAVLDELTGVFYADDGQVVNLYAKKRYGSGRTGCWVFIKPVL